jgi:dephospho-CoA kinase
VRALIVERLGDEVAPGGELDRSLVAERVFQEDERRGWLEGVLWPRVGERMVAWKADVDASDPPPVAAVVEVPLLFESGMESAFDHTIAVIADEEVRQRRAAERGHAALASRAGRQLSQGEKAERAEFVVRNDGSLAELKQALSRVLGTIGAT